jgi:O-methyltransferase
VALTGFASQVEPFTKSSRERIAAMAGAIEATRTISGDIVECGVWRGGNIILARKMAPERVCWLYDTFEGMTKPEAVDVTRTGRKAFDSYRAKTEAGRRWAAASFEEVCQALEQTGTWDESKLRFVTGRVEQTLLEPKNLPDGSRCCGSIPTGTHRQRSNWKPFTRALLRAAS